MNVFISWSGPLSRAFAELLVAWFPDVIQRVKPWLSSQDIDKGSLWPAEINEALSTTIGILCVTQENKDAPWLLFEAGALSKGLTKARVCPLLIDLEPKDIQPPLSLFNLTLPENADMWQLVKSINSADPDNALVEERLKKAFDHRWPDFERESKSIREKHKTMTKAPERSEKAMIVEVLEITRAIQRAVERAESLEQIAFSPLSGVTPPGLSGYSGYSSPKALYELIKAAELGKPQKAADNKMAAALQKAAEKKPEKESNPPSES